MANNSSEADFQGIPSPKVLDNSDNIDNIYYNECILMKGLSEINKINSKHKKKGLQC